MKSGAKVRRKRVAEPPVGEPLGFSEAPAPEDEDAHYNELAYAMELERRARACGWRDV